MSNCSIKTAANQIIFGKDYLSDVKLHWAFENLYAYPAYHNMRRASFIEEGRQPLKFSPNFYPESFPTML